MSDISAATYYSNDLKKAIGLFVNAQSNSKIQNSLRHQLTLCVEQILNNTLKSSKPGVIGADAYIDELTIEISCAAYSALIDLNDTKTKSLVKTINTIIDRIQAEINELCRFSSKEAEAKRLVKSREYRAWAQLLMVIENGLTYKSSETFQHFVEIRQLFNNLESQSKTRTPEKAKELEALVKTVKPITTNYYINTCKHFKTSRRELSAKAKYLLAKKTRQFIQDVKKAIIAKQKKASSDQRSNKILRAIIKSLKALASIATLDLACFRKRQYGNLWSKGSSNIKNKLDSISNINIATHEDKKAAHTTPSAAAA